MDRCSLIPVRDQLSIWLGFCALALGLAASCGCAGQPGGEPVVCNCRVVVDGQVLHDVHVVLYQEASNQPLMEGTSDATGTVGLKLVEGASISEESSIKLKATVESIGDWQVIAPWSSKEKTPLRVDYAHDNDTLEIELPSKALKAL